jgi:anti-sigma factor RsiW
MRARRRRREPHTLAGAYALDALAETERLTFERHMARCEACAQEVASLREAAAALAAASAVPPPPALRQQVAAAAAGTRQASPPGVPAPRLRLPGWRARVALAAGTLAAAAAIALAAVFGVSNGSMQQQLNRAQASSQGIASVLTAQDATMMTGQVVGGGTATIVMSPSRHALVFTAAGLPKLPGSRRYELWLIGPGGPRIGMPLQVSGGMTSPVIASGLRHGDRLALSAEPAAGSWRPTGPMMLDIAL